MTNDEPLLDLDFLLNPEEQARFRRLCLATSAEELGQMEEDVRLHVEQVAAQATTRTDTETAAAIAGSLVALLAEAASFDHEQRSLVRGAVEYFILAEDASGDLDDVLGFDDDARILNSVLDRLGRSDLRVVPD